MWNPLNWIKLLSLAKSIIDIVAGVVRWVQDWWNRRAQQKQVDQAKQAEQQLEDANQIQDPDRRLKEKANAACKLEQAIDPNRKC